MAQVWNRTTLNRLLGALVAVTGLFGATAAWASDPPPDGVPVPSGYTAEHKRAKSTFEGFFVQLGLGYSTSGGDGGPVIPDVQQGAATSEWNFGTFQDWRNKGCLYGDSHCYNRAITTDRGAGLAAAFQLGYNIKGYADLALDFAWNGSFGSTADMAGAGAVSPMVGIHPLRFWRDDLPADVRLYTGFGAFDILYYYETEFQTEAKGKAWTGTSVPFGLQGEYKFDKNGAFALGLDLRFVRASYTKWIYNNDKDIASHMDSNPVTTMRFAPRVNFAFHF